MLRHFPPRAVLIPLDYNISTKTFSQRLSNDISHKKSYNAFCVSFNSLLLIHNSLSVLIFWSGKVVKGLAQINRYYVGQIFYSVVVDF